MTRICATCNYQRIQKTLHTLPAMAAGVTDKLWSVEDIPAVIDATAPKPGKRGPYKKRTEEISNQPRYRAARNLDGAGQPA